MPNEGLGNGQPALTRHYKRLLAGADALGGAGALERTAGPGPDLSEGAVDERMGATRAELHRIVKEFLGDKPELYEIADNQGQGLIDAPRQSKSESRGEVERHKKGGTDMPTPLKKRTSGLPTGSPSANEAHLTPIDDQMASRRGRSRRAKSACEPEDPSRS